jgi:hypothetical protein
MKTSNDADEQAKQISAKSFNWFCIQISIISISFSPHPKMNELNHVIGEHVGRQKLNNQKSDALMMLMTRKTMQR